MIVRRVISLLVACVLACAWLLLVGAPAGAQRSREGPRLEQRACPVDVPSGLRADCYGLLVPAVRGDPRAGSTRLAVAVLHGQGRGRAPVLFTAGGPGVTTIGRLAGWRGSPLLEGRDLILLEQRGAEFSDPALTCPEVDDALLANIMTVRDDGVEVSRVANAARSCRARLLRGGARPEGVTTAASAADVADLRVALGLREWLLYGASYSTKLMLAVMRDHPEGVTGVVLDSVLPPDEDLYGSADASLAAALRAVDPGLEAKLERVEARADADPIVLEVDDPLGPGTVTMRLTGIDVRTGVQAALYDPDVAARLPLVLGSLADGDESVVRPLAAEGFGDLFAQADGMAYSIRCHEAVPFRSGDAELLGYDSDPAACEKWDVPVADVRIREPVTSDIPALVITGARDPITPPATARAVASHLPNATLVVVPGGGHTPSFSGSCLPSVVRRFLADPRIRPNTGCVGGMHAPALVTRADVRTTPGFFRLSEDIATLGAPGLAAMLVAALLALLIGGTWSAVSLRADRGALVATLTTMAVGAHLAAIAGLAAVALTTPDLTLAFGMPRAWSAVLVLPVVGAVSGIGLLMTVALRPSSARATIVPALLTSGGAVALWAALAVIGLALPN